MTRIVLLPRQFDATLEELASLEQESNGILLYKRQGNFLPVEYIFMTGIGTGGHVQADQKRMDVANEFFKRNPAYNYVKFHTHSKGTGRQFGDYFATHFSAGDIETYREQLKENSDFIGMVVTPTTKLLYAPDNPTIGIVRHFPSKANSKIQVELAQIAAVMGYDLGKFQATRRT